MVVQYCEQLIKRQLKILAKNYILLFCKMCKNPLFSSSIFLGNIEGSVGAVLRTVGGGVGAKLWKSPKALLVVQCCEQS